MFAAQQNLHQIVNFLSVRTKNLNVEDKDGTTILMHHVLQGNYKMSSRLIYRGAKIDMVNKFGKTALHLCVEKKLNEAVDYLLYKGANPHILDLTEQDCCDKAKEKGEKYARIKKLHEGKFDEDRSLRIKNNEYFKKILTDRFNQPNVKDKDKLEELIIKVTEEINE